MRLVSRANRPHFDTLLLALRSGGYNVTWGPQDARDYGIPQSRIRLYIVGILKTHQSSTFRWPLPLERQLTIAELLDPLSPLDDLNRRPIAPQAARNFDYAQAKHRRGDTRDWMIPQQLSDA